MTEEKNKKGYIWTIIILLALNTFFLAGIWCSVKHAHHSKQAFCPITGKNVSADKMMCPITGKEQVAPSPQTN